jgi:hypothetical protein
MSYFPVHQWIFWMKGICQDFHHLQTDLVDDLEATDLELKMEIYPKWILSYYYFLGCIIATF